MIKITLFGVGSTKYRQLYHNLKIAISDYLDSISTEEINDIDSFVNYGVEAVPALAINNQVLTKGNVPTTEEIRTFIQQYLNTM